MKEYHGKKSEGGVLDDPKGKKPEMISEQLNQIKKTINEI